MSKINVLIINGPNLNLLGKREPEIYGSQTIDEINDELISFANLHQMSLTVFQSNHEGEIVDKIQEAAGTIDYIVINPAAYTHTSIAIRDALLTVALPVIEVHLSNIYKRESFRRKSLITDIAQGQISGLGTCGYFLALEAILKLYKK